AEEYEQAIKALRNMSSLEEQAKDLERQREEHRKAVAHFMEKEVVNG
ncbi:hypothetical protein LCGC14_2891120, partial [marine sediment metagenome]